MKEFIIKPAHLSRIELWAATTVFVFVIFFLVADLGFNNQYHFEQARVAYDYYNNYFFPQLFKYILLYLSFLLLNFRVVPSLLERKNLFRSVAIIVAVFVVMGMTFGITDTYLRAYQFKDYKTDQAFYDFIFLKSYVRALWVLMLFGVYNVVKYCSIYLLSNSAAISTKYRIISRDSLVAFVLWMISIFIMLVGGVEEELLICWAIFIPFAIFFYCYSSYTLLPASFSKRKPFQAYLLKTLLVLVITFIPVSFFIFIILHNEGFSIAGGFFNSAFQLFFIAPLSWVLFKRRMQGNEEIVGLQKELGRSNANLDFLRSQINPHFLFNALNTIYATAINEKADRTSEAIEQLGDMMRFMLHENMQDKISLAREIEYLNNYVGLQKLRTEHNPSLKIETHIEQNSEMLWIAPMLLIPFVENAFKHGISFREPSQIRIVLEVRDRRLNFDVYNSKHEKPENDPEKDHSGIGLNNVKQRLKLLYPGKHDLIVRETQKEFFIHLTVQLS